MQCDDCSHDAQVVKVLIGEHLYTSLSVSTNVEQALHCGIALLKRIQLLTITPSQPEMQQACMHFCMRNLAA